ncbi:hypothetical protein BWQ96_09079 [Gracilariopsis chorda]|uniref:Transmembrane protein n=1 Tax=Gracilariopsis chorda TaxID=448386 RepID=A0A2V3IGK7_9FLOR|nr:hypothetical protein BWQ96_09079 [Gracilariopsis chorda]|eukprot:PXF41224.1 hypothetical protein BWQ96_09079 [Gracilariopsis chorda]
MASLAAAFSLARHIPRDLPTILSRQQQQQNDPTQSQSVVFLLLGALLGVAYSLGTEKYMRAMRHPHIFVRNAMLWLSAIAWLFAAAAVIWLASRIYNQVDGGLEGFDRSMGVLIPFVVRADLIVDWAKRVAWALINMSTWTQSTVQLRRLLRRAPQMEHAVCVNHDVTDLFRTSESVQSRLLTAENQLWTQDAHSLVHLSELVHHFEKLGRVAVYALAVLVGAIPAALAWLVYAVYQIIICFRCSAHAPALLYTASIMLTPVFAFVLIISSIILLGGVVSLSVVGTIIQFSVYWSTRIAYYMVRVLLSQQWAGFPHLRTLHTMHAVDPDIATASMIVRGIRSPAEASIAMAEMGSLLPTELEFSLSSWDGTDKRKGGRLKPISVSISRHVRTLSFIGDFVDRHSSSANSSPPNGNPSASSTANTKETHRSELDTAASSAESGRHNRQLQNADRIPSSIEVHGSEARTDEERAKDRNVAILLLMQKLGLDLSVKSGRRRRLSTFYAFAMLVHMQIESGGNAWRLNSVEYLCDSDFKKRISSFSCVIADEASIAVEELSNRLKVSSKYRVVPTGYPSSRMVPVADWLRSALLGFLDADVDMVYSDDKAPEISALSVEGEEQ